MQRILIWTRKELVFQYLTIIVGSAIFALAIVLFLLPYKVAPGGVSGVAIIVNRLYNIPAGMFMLALNIIIFFVGLRHLGLEFGTKSLVSSAAIALFTDLFNEILHLKINIHDPILAPIFGGVVLGVGLGLVLRSGGGTLGSNTLARIIVKYTNLPQSAAIMIINGIIVIVAGVAFRKADIAFYSLISIYTSSIAIDLIVEGIEYARGTFIISDKNPEIEEAVLNELRRGGTVLKGRGLYTGKDKEVLFSVVTIREINELVSLVHKIDPKAFVVVTPVHEVLGKGFRPRL